MTDNYFIFTETGDKFCRRYVDENGDVQLQTKNGTIPFMKLQTMVMNPAEALKQRGKKPRQNQKMRPPHMGMYDDPEELII